MALVAGYADVVSLVRYQDGLLLILNAAMAPRSSLKSLSGLLKIA